MNSGPPIRRGSRTNQSAGRSGSASTPKRTARLAAVVAVVAWLRHGEPIPDGWRVAAQRATHHHRHAFLIEQVTP
jgi:hypothetical protein